MRFFELAFSAFAGFASAAFRVFLLSWVLGFFGACPSVAFPVYLAGVAPVGTVGFPAVL